VLTFLGGSALVRSIQNGDIDNAAGIARSKLASGSAYRVLANGASGAVSELASTGTTGQVLTSNGASALPTFQTLVIPYDLAGEAVGSLSVGQVVFHFIAPRPFSMTALTQDSSSTAVIEIQKNGLAGVIPGLVAQNDVITAVVTTAGTDVWFTVTGNV
jgi:hypothetical protein